jgi:hypothetical protein
MYWFSLFLPLFFTIIIDFETETCTYIYRYGVKKKEQPLIVGEGSHCLLKTGSYKSLSFSFLVFSSLQMINTIQWTCFINLLLQPEVINFSQCRLSKSLHITLNPKGKQTWNYILFKSNFIIKSCQWCISIQTENFYIYQKSLYLYKTNNNISWKSRIQHNFYIYVYLFFFLLHISNL